MDIINELFEKSKPDFSKLEKYGFKKNNNKYTFKKNFYNDEFKLILTISNNEITSKVIDNNLNEEYIALNIKNNQSSYANEVKNGYKLILNDIKDNCFITSNFTYEQTNRIVKYIYNKYNDKPEFLWEGYDYGVFRNKNNKKWYTIIMNTKSIKSNDYPHNKEILNLKLDRDKIKELLKIKGFYKAYHMSKIDWITIVLDKTLKDEEIIKLIDESYNLVNNPNEWIIPANANYFDVISYFDNNKIVEWKQSTNILENDIIYIYVGAPYSKIMYKCRAIKVNILYNYSDNNIKMKKLMQLEVINKYNKDILTFKKLNELGIKSIRGPRKISKKVSDEISKVK